MTHPHPPAASRTAAQATHPDATAARDVTAKKPLTADTASHTSAVTAGK
ncbi:hypothetical protein ABZ851_11455 [Streptomyces sp. NPDC047049]